MDKQFQSLIHLAPDQTMGHKTMGYRRWKAIGWVFALLTAWLLSLVVVEPVAAQSEIAPSTPCFTSTNLTNLSTGGNRGITNQPVISGNGARVSFWSVNNLGGGNVDGNIEVFVRETGSNSVVQLTNSVGSILGGFNLEPSINTAGTHIAFYSDRDLVEGQNADGNFEIFLARRAGNGTWTITQVTNTQGSANLFPSINAAGNRIVFVSDDSELHNIDQTRVNADRNFEIFLATIPNSGAIQFRQLTNTGAGVTNDQPVINASGSRVAFTAATGQTAQVFVWDESQNAPTQLTQTDINDQASISADGTSIVYIATTTDDRSRVVLHTLSADGTESRAEVIVPAATNTKYRSPSISGNGKRVVYVSEQGSGAALQINVQLYDVNTRLGVPISEVGGGTGEQPAISSDGTRVTFVGVQAVGGSTDNTGSDIYLNECPQADLTLEFVNPPIASVLAGVDVQYQFRVTNKGPSVAADTFFHSDLGALPGLPANVNRLLPPGCTVDANDLFCPLGDLAVNASRVFTFGYDIPSNAGLADIVSQIDVGANVVDSSPADNATAQFKTRIFEESALSLAVTTNPSTIVAGSPDQLEYILTVTNAGPSQARSARITDTLPTGSTFVSVQLTSGGGAGANCSAPVGGVVACDLRNLTAGSVTVVRIRVRANASAPPTLTNVATVRSLTQESNLANNTVVTQTPVERLADMAITKVATPTLSVVAGTEITYTLSFTNLGFADTEDAVVIDNLPQNVTYQRSILPSGASCTPSGGGQIVTCNFPGDLLVNQSRTFSFVALVQSVVPAGPITNTATIRSALEDPNSANDVSPGVQTEVTLLADLVVSKTVNNTTPDIFEVVTYTVQLRNDGPSQAYNVVVTDLLPLEMTFVSADASVGSYDDGAGLWTVGTLPVAPVGQEETLIIRAFVQADGGGDTKTNTATAGGSQPEPDNDLPSSDSVNLIAQRADIRVVKTSSPTSGAHVIAGQRLTYTLSVRNLGPTLARSVLMTDVLPANIFLVAVNEPVGRADCVAGATTITCDVGNMNNSQELFYTVVVTRELKGVITNTVSVSTRTPDLTLGNNSTSHSIIVDPDVPHHLVFTQQPPAIVTAGDVFNPLPVVEIRDRFNNLINNTLGSTDTIRLEPYRDSGTPCTLLATQSALLNNVADAVGGSVTFPGLSYTIAERIRLRAVDIEPSRSVTPACSNAVGVNPDEVSTLQFVTPSRVITAGDISDVITISRTDQFGNDNLVGDLTIELQENSEGTGSFLANPASIVPISTLVIFSGTASSSFYYTDTIAGNYTITGTAPGGVTPAVQSMTVNAAPAQELLVVISAPLTTTAGISSDLFTVQRTDRFANPNTTDPDVTVDLTTDSISGNGVFRNIANSLTVTRVTILQGSSTTQFRYRDTLAEVHQLGVTDGAHILIGDSVTITVVPSTTYRLVIDSTPLTITAGTVSDPIRVERRDFFGNNNFDDNSLQVNLSTSSTSGAGEFQNTAFSPVSFVTIAKGSDFAEFRYTDELADVFTLTASATGILADTQDITVIADVPEHLAIITTTFVITAGAPPFPITIQRQDQFDNPAPDDDDLVINLQKQSPQGSFLQSNSPTVITQVTITETDASFRYQDFQQGNWILTYTDNGAFVASQPITVTAAVPAKLVYLQKPITMTAGIRSTIFEVQRRDIYDNPYAGPEALTVYLTSSSPGSSEMFINGIDTNTVVTSMIIAGSTSTTTFYYNDMTAGAHLITADDIGALTPATTTLTVQSAGADKLVFINTPISATAGITSGQLTVQVQDNFGNAVTPTVGSPVNVNLFTSAVSPPARFANAANNDDITSLVIQGTSLASFRYYDEKAATASITAQPDGGLLSDSEFVTVVAAPANHLVFTTQPLTLTAGVTSTIITIQRRDKFNNPNLNDPSRRMSLTENSPSVPRFIHATNNTLLPGNLLTITVGSSDASFRYYDTARGQYTITASSTIPTAITGASQGYKVLGAAPVRLQLVGPSSQTAGTPVQYTITAFDQFSNQSDPYTGNHALTFGGTANAAPNGTQPTVTNLSGTPINFGSATTITFASGLATAGGSVTLYDATGSGAQITANDTLQGISATGVNAHTVSTVVAAALNTIQAETTSGGEEVAVIVPSQTIIPNQSVSLFAVGRDVYGNSRGNVSSTWVMTQTAGVIRSDLVPAAAVAATSATFTGHVPGTAIIEPRTSGAIPVPSGKITVTAGADAIVRVETQPDGTGVVVPAQSLTAGMSISVYAIVRDSSGNFKSNPITATWSIVTATAGVNTSNNLSTLSGSTTTFTAKQIGTGRIRATVGSLARTESGVLTVNAGLVARFGITVTSNTVTPNAVRTLFITAQDAYSNVIVTYDNSHTLRFSGANPSRAPVTSPYVVNGSNVSTTFGLDTPITFNDGINTKNGNRSDMYLFEAPYPSPVVVVTALEPSSGISGTLTMTVNPGGMSRIAISAPSANLVAGQPVSLTLTGEDIYGNRIPTYTGQKTLVFSGSPDPNVTGTPSFPATVTQMDPPSGNVNFGTGTPIVFASGASSASGGDNGAMTLYKSGAFTISVQQSDSAFPSGIYGRKIFTVTSSQSQVLALNLTSPQSNRTAFIGATNLVTLTDIYRNPVSARPVTITTSLPGVVKIAGSGDNNVLENELAATGSANLSSGGLAMRYEGVAAATGTFTATATNLLGGFLTATDSVLMNNGPASLLRIQGATATNQTLTNNLVVFAGQPISLSMRIVDADGNVVLTEDVARNLRFTVTPAPATNATVSNNSGGAIVTNASNDTAITFADGVSTIASNGNNGRFLLYNVGTYTLTATAATPALTTQTGHTLVVTVVPGPADRVEMALTNNQTNTLPFVGVNTLTVFDQYNNLATNFGGNGEGITVTVSNQTTETISFSGAPTGVLTATHFSNGVANLTALGMTYTGLVSPTPQFVATLRKFNGTLDTSSTISVTMVAGPATSFALDIPSSSTTAGVAIASATLKPYDVSRNQRLVTESYVLTFTGALTATDGTGPSIDQSGLKPFDQGVTINFTGGTATFSVNLYRAETANIFVKRDNTQVSNIESVTVNPASQASFNVNIATTQPLSATFNGPAEITAIDTYSNVVTSFEANAANVTVTVINSPTCGTTPTIVGLGSALNHVLNEANDFDNGVANLLANGNSIQLNSACAGSHRFRFTATGGFGDSANITFGP